MKRAAHRALTSSPRAGGWSAITAWPRARCCTRRQQDAFAATCPIRCRWRCWDGWRSTRHWQGRGLGAALLRDAVLRVIGAAETIGVRALLVHAISEEAKAFYERWGFRPSAIEPMTLMITIEEAQRMLGRER